MSRGRFLFLAVGLGLGAAAIGCEAPLAPSAVEGVRLAVLVPPPDEDFVPFLCGGAPATDPVGDVAGGTAHRDIVGDADYPALFYAADASLLYLRMRVDADPVQAPGNLRPFGWGFEFDQDSDLTTFEYLLLASGIGADSVTWQHNTVQATLDVPSDPAEVTLVTYAPTVDYWASSPAPGSSFGGNPDFFITLAVPRADLVAAGISLSSPVVVWSGTSNSTHALNVDASCHDGATGAATLSGSAIDPAILDPSLDPDGDGLLSTLEATLGTDPWNRDSDGDGISDYVETDGGLPVDTDGDGIIDALDLDSDDDGLPDSVEGVVDSDGDGIPDYRDDDDDDDGIPTRVEVADSAALGNDDVDGDGFVNWLDAEADGDGIGDGDEGRADADGDGVPAYLDPDEHGESRDSDGDGLTDAEERALGTDPESADSDGDGIGDFVETDGGLAIDTDGDGIIDALDTDSDGDGLPDALEGVVDTDGDGIPDYRDDDDDGDGILTRFEVADSAALGDDDVDGDGLVNWHDTDSDGDGIDDGDEGRADGDGDGVPAYLDPDERGEGPDSDGDGLSDALERALGTDPHSPDSDGDGIGDFVETDGGLAIDTDGDGIIDALDLDSDDDGLPDSVEGVRDTDGDGIPDYRDEDDDGDGISTRAEVEASRELGNDDVDGDGLPNWLDPDSDGDGIPDGEEGEGDSNGNGVPDYLDPSRGGLAGGSFCAVAADGPAGGSGWLLLGLALSALAGMRRRSRSRPRRAARPFPPIAGVLLAFAALSAGPRAEAQEGGVTLDQFRAAETTADGFAISRPDDLGHLRFSAQLHLDYANDPLVWEDEQGDRTSESASVVRHHFVGHFGLALGLIDRLVVFAGLPVSFLMAGDEVPGQPGPEGTSAGDLYLGLRSRIWGGPADLFSVGAQLSLTAPTAQASADRLAYAGEQSFTGHLEVMGEVRLERVRLTVDLGARFRDPVDLGTLRVGQELTYGLGVTVNVVDRWLLGLFEVYGATTFERFANRESSPLEMLFGGIVTIGPSWRVGLAAGPGLSRGYGSPDARVVLTAGYTYVPAAEPEPEPEPEPERGDRDRDGIRDDLDQCPDQPEDRDGFEDEDGCPDPDNDGDGVLDAQDRCPDEAEDRDGFEDEDGCPDPDNDGDGVLDADDRCPTAPGAPEDDGCPRDVRVEAERITTLRRIEFATDSDRLLARSLTILEEVRATLAANPQITRVRIEGHTDSQGEDAHNLELSRRRAETVRRWLVEHGIQASRLTAEGFGETRPIEDDATAAGRQANRRVEFHIVR